MKNILIVDDNQMIRDSLSSYLSHKLKNYTVLTAEDGAQAINMMDSVPISLVLTDLEMPRIDGYGVILHAKQHHPSVLVCIMTGSWTTDLLMLVRKLDLVPCIEKPFRFEEVERMVIELLEKGAAKSVGMSPYGEHGETSPQPRMNIQAYECCGVYT
jgi:two-component system response regulator PilR (NtrC family)